MRFNNQRAFSLIELLVSLALLAALALFGSRVYASLSAWWKLQDDVGNAKIASAEITGVLKNRLDGSRNYQNLNLHIPNSGTPGFQSTGPGIYVVPNTNFGNIPNPLDASGSPVIADVLYVVSRISGGAESTLLNTFNNLGEAVGGAASGSWVNLNSSTAAVVNEIYQSQLDLLKVVPAAGQFAVVSNTQMSDIFSTSSVTTPAWVNVIFQAQTPPLAVLATLAFPDLQSAQSPTFQYGNPTQRLGNYLRGDSMSRAEITKFSFDINPGQLVIETLSQNTMIRLGVRLSFFSVSAVIAASTGCAVDSAGLPSRSQWADINANPACYKNIRSLRIALKNEPGPILNYDVSFN